MKTVRIEKGLIRPAVRLASAIAVIAAGCAAPQEKPIKLRYWRTEVSDAPAVMPLPVLLPADEFPTQLRRPPAASSAATGPAPS